MSKLFLAGEVFHGTGTLEELKNLKGNKAIVVIGGKSVRTNGVLDRSLAYLKEAGLETTVFDGVEPDPSVDTVLKGAEAFRSFNPDWIIGLGGCSAIDAAKAMWIFYEYPEARFEDMIKPFAVPELRKKARFVAIPSTSGTGTEMTGLAVITDRVKGVKYPVVSYELTPDIAIVDGEICATMPANVTANTGLDALTHCVEAYVSNIEDNYADAFAKGGTELVFSNLKTAVDKPDNLEARQNMHDASCLGGFAFTNAWLGIVHSLAHQIGAMYGIPHGCANAILLPNVIRYNSKATDKYNDLAKMFGGQNAEDFAQEVEKLRKSTGVVPSSIKEYGVDETEWKKNLDYISLNAMNDPCTGFNPRKPTLDELSRIYQACYDGVKTDF
jgi:alcohol dehydrogenase class IV